MSPLYKKWRKRRIAWYSTAALEIAAGIFCMTVAIVQVSDAMIVGNPALQLGMRTFTYAAGFVVLVIGLQHLHAISNEEAL